jgi:cytidylate kinase
VSHAIVAIDGPAASGKSSTAQAVAAGLGFRHLDSGALYRGVTLAAVWAALPRPFDANEVIAAAERWGVDFKPRNGDFEVVAAEPVADASLRGAAVTERVSEIAALAEVRSWVNEHIRGAARAGGAVVVDGRDIGSVVFPEAQLKVYLTASPAARAERRLRQRGAVVDPDQLQGETEALAARDHADSNREVAPLTQAQDAVGLDTSNLSFDEQVAFIIELARSRHLAP